jgi:hypothetical protein
MNKQQRLTFQRVAAEIGPPSLFRRTGGSLVDFVENVVAPQDTSASVGAKILQYFCLDDDGKANDFLPGIQLAIGFLDAVMTAPSDPAQRRQSLVDLKAILQSGNAASQLPAWVASYYK